jgi:hypothetical protein
LTPPYLANQRDAHIHLSIEEVYRIDIGKTIGTRRRTRLQAERRISFVLRVRDGMDQRQQDTGQKNLFERTSDEHGGSFVQSERQATKPGFPVMD